MKKSLKRIAMLIARTVVIVERRKKELDYKKQIPVKCKRKVTHSTHPFLILA